MQERDCDFIKIIIIGPIISRVSLQ